jgi:hypothetical protein
MTDLMSRPILRVPPSAATPERTVQLSGALAGGVVAAVGLIVCLACSVGAWFSADTGSFGGGVRAGVLAWLLANGASLHTPVATITMVPLGAVFSAAGLVYLGGRWAGRHSAVASLRDVARGGAALAATYGFVVLIAAGVARGGEVNAGVVRPTLAALALGLAVGGAGILRGAGLTHRLLARLPVRLRAAAAGALAGVAVMLVAGALLVAGSLVAHFSLAVNLAEDLHTGIVGGILVALIGVAVLPNAVLCAGAFAAGPGFAVGVGTAVAPGGVTLGALPVFPLLAAVPHDADARWLQALVLVPVIAGVAAGLTAIRRCPAARWDTAGLMGGLAGLLGGLVFGVLCELASGAVGPGRMQDIGPDVLATLAVCVVAGAMGGALAAGGSTFVRGLRHPRPPCSPSPEDPESQDSESQGALAT